MGRKKRDITGQRFGMLTVICEAPRPEGIKSKGTYWMCKCDCGNEIVASLTSLKTQKSCGCLKREINRKKLKKYNKYDLSGEYGVCYPYNSDDEILFDLEDYEKIKDYCWFITYAKKDKKGYKTAHGKTFNCEKRKSLSMHRFILGINDSSIIIDHINRNPLDNRKSNLRTCTIQQNVHNTEAVVGEYKGVSKREGVKGDKWCAYITSDGVHHWLGTFDTPEQAALAYNEAALKYHGEFAYLNDVHSEDEIKETI